MIRDESYRYLPLAKVASDAARGRLGQRMLCLDSWFVCAPHAHTPRLHDPELMFGPFRGQDRKNPDDQLKHLSSAGLCRSKHHDADILARRICPDVGEIEVEREEHARLSLARRPDRRKTMYRRIQWTYASSVRWL